VSCVIIVDAVHLTCLIVSCVIIFVAVHLTCLILSCVIIVDAVHFLGVSVIHLLSHGNFSTKWHYTIIVITYELVRKEGKELKSGIEVK